MSVSSLKQIGIVEIKKRGKFNPFLTTCYVRHNTLYFIDRYYILKYRFSFFSVWVSSLASYCPLLVLCWGDGFLVVFGIWNTCLQQAKHAYLNGFIEISLVYVQKL